MTKEQEGSLKARASKALEDQFLRKAVAFTTNKLRTNKEKTTHLFGDWEKWRVCGSQIRLHTIRHLDYYLDQFATQVERQGGHVHFAVDAAEARRRVLEIARQHGAKKLVKAKSMVTEEIGLNEALEEEGMTVIESDLGEYIIQLAGEKPSHIIIPAIHKNREEIRKLFQQVDNSKSLTSDTSELTSFARAQLRKVYMESDIGITGCNFAVAETGSITMVTNEGNGRMVNTIPKVHIVVMGMERIVPTWDDLEVMLNLLPRSATGQNLTAYVSILNGPKRMGETDGAEEMHVIIVDNGRSRQLGDPDFFEVLKCIRCGACLNVCPVYRQIGGHAYGSVYPGPIGAVLTPLLEDDYEKRGDLAYASSLCGACYEACPVKIPLHDMLVKLRDRAHKRTKGGFIEKMMFKGYQLAFQNHRMYHLGIRTAYYLQKPLVRKGVIKAGPPPLSGWTNSRDFPAIGKEPFRDRFKKMKQNVTGSTSMIDEIDQLLREELQDRRVGEGDA